MTCSDEAKKVLQGVTPGPWFTSPDGWRVTDKIVSFDEDGARHGETPNICIFAESEANARFIAWCREGVPALLSENEALRDQRDMWMDRAMNELGENLNIAAAQPSPDVAALVAALEMARDLLEPFDDPDLSLGLGGNVIPKIDAALARVSAKWVGDE